MGYKKYTSKREKIEDNREYIISQLLGLDANPVSAANLAKEYDCTERYLNRIIREWRDKGFLGFKRETPLEDDKDLISALHKDGMSIRELARKWECSASSMHEALERWGVKNDHQHAGKPIGKMSLDDFKKNWADVDGPINVTVGRIPRFYVCPLKG